MASPEVAFDASKCMHDHQIKRGAESFVNRDCTDIRRQHANAPYELATI
jgi:hypothetical protein